MSWIEESAERMYPGSDITYGVYAVREAYAYGANEALKRLAQPVVNSVEELDALPLGTVIVINGTMLQADDRDDYGTMWSRVRDIDAYPSEALALPARVLYRPEVTDG